MKHCAEIRTSLKKSFLLAFLFAWQHVSALNGDTSALITTENEVTRPVVVNYIFNSDGTLNNSHKYANVVYYKLEWKNNKWVRTFDKASTNISITGAEFPIWDVYTVMRYYNESDLLAERIYGADGIERDPTPLLSNSNAALSVTHQAAKHLSVFINSELNSLFSDEEYTAECVKVSDGYDVNVTVFDKRGMTEFKVKVSEFSVHLDNAMSREEMIALLDHYGMKRSYSYEYYLFSNNLPHTIERWAIFQDESVKQPPLAGQPTRFFMKHRAKIRTY